MKNIEYSTEKIDFFGKKVYTNKGLKNSKKELLNMKKMKKHVKILTMVAVIFIITGVTVFAATLGKSNSSFVRIREKATTQSNVIDALMEGDQVEILGEEGDWYKVSAKGHIGYVSKAFITKNGEESNNANQNDNNNSNPTDNNQNNENNQQQENNTTPEKQTATIVTRIYKVSEGTSVYILPLISSEVIGKVNAGESIDLINSTGLWGFIRNDKIAGWVRLDKLSSEEVTKVVEVPAEESNNGSNNNNAQQNNTNQNANQVENKEQQNTENKQEQQQANYQEKTMYVSVAAVNVRKESNTNSEVVSGAEINTAFTVVGEENGWYKVKVNGNNFGYIRKDLLSDSKTENTSRSNTTDRAEAKAQMTTQNVQVSTVTNTNNNVQTAQAQVNTTESQTQAATTEAQAQATTPAPTASSSGVTGEDIVAYAKQFLNCKYSYGAAGPSAFDCSGFTMYVYKHFGYNLNRTSRAQATQGVKVTGELQAGDILVFSNDGKQVGHVGIYIGNDKFIHASDSTTGVIISNLHDSWNIKKYWGARRIL